MHVNIPAATLIGMAQRSEADGFISNNEREFILAALRDEQRVGGRKPFDARNITFQASY